MTIDLDRAAVGLPITRAGVSLFPLYLHQRAGDIAPGTGARLTITEQADATVPSVRLENPTDRLVLVPAGTVIEGGQQNRVLTTSVLVPAATGLDVPVSCVQRGRWGGGREFALSRAMAPRRVRRASTESVRENLAHGRERRADQGHVWRSVDHELHAAAVHSHDADLTELQRSRERDTRWRDAVEDLVQRGPLPGQVGVVVAHGRRVVAAELVATPDLLAVHWEALVRSQLAERVEDPEGTPSASRALAFVRRFGTARTRVAPAVGLGRELHVEDAAITGQALVHDDVLVHASAFVLAA